MLFWTKFENEVADVSFEFHKKGGGSQAWYLLMCPKFPENKEDMILTSKILIIRFYIFGKRKFQQSKTGKTKSVGWIYKEKNSKIKTVVIFSPTLDEHKAPLS